MDKQLIIAQYKSFSDHRIHFSRLYFALVAFVILVCAPALFITLQAQSDKLAFAVLMLLVAVFMIFGGYIALRLKQREESYANLLAQIEANNESLLSSPKAGGKGARFLVVAALILVGASFVTIAILNFRSIGA